MNKQLLAYAEALRATAMTLPDERYRAVLQTAQFLGELCDPRATPRVPKRIRERARSLLRHYPSRYDMYYAAKSAPEVFAERMEDLHRFIVKGSEPLDGDENI